MSKGLEALKSLFDTMPFAFLESNTMKDLKIIDKELKAFNIIKNLPIIIHNNVINLICKNSEEAEKIKEILKNDD